MPNHEYTATVVWERDREQFTDARYSRAHEWCFDGGISVRASSSPLVVPLPYSSENAVDPEEAFVVSLSSCHMLYFLSLAAGRGFVVDTYRDTAIGVMGKNAEGKIAMLSVTLDPEIAWSGEHRPRQEEIDGMHHEAHDKCFIANSVRTDVRMAPRAAVQRSTAIL